MSDPLDPRQILEIQDAAQRMNSMMSVHLDDAATIEDVDECYDAVISAAEEPLGATGDSLAETATSRRLEINDRSTAMPTRMLTLEEETSQSIELQAESDARNPVKLADVDVPFGDTTRDTE
eukprot:416021-Amphidinium_carterae.1